MDLQLYLNILKRRAVVIVIVAVMTVLVEVVAYAYIIKPLYTANTTINVVMDVGINNSGLYADYTNRLLNTYVYILKSDAFLERTISLLPQRYSGLTSIDLLSKDKINISIVLNTSVISISVKDRDPYLAQILANTMANLLVQHGQDFILGTSKTTRQILEEQLAGIENELKDKRQKYALLLANGSKGPEVDALSQDIKLEEDSYTLLLNRYELERVSETHQALGITVISPAKQPRLPSNMFGYTQLFIGILVGIFGGLGLGLMFENLDTRIHNIQQLEQISSLPIVGNVPVGLISALATSQKEKKKNNLMAEAYRLLAINLQTLKDEISAKSILITSATVQEDKSTVTANLALIISEREQPVFLVDSNLKNPVLETIIGQDRKMGLSNLLNKRVPITDEVIEKIITPLQPPWLWKIGIGSEDSNLSAKLTSPRLTELMNHLGSQGRTILIDSPAVLETANVSILAQTVDGVVIVVRESRTRREQLIAAINQLQMNRSKIIGLIFLRKN